MPNIALYLQHTKVLWHSQCSEELVVHSLYSLSELSDVTREFA
mgnify:CR=1 FL=1